MIFGKWIVGWELLLNGFGILGKGRERIFYVVINVFFFFFFNIDILWRKIVLIWVEYVVCIILRGFGCGWILYLGGW